MAHHKFDFIESLHPEFSDRLRKIFLNEKKSYFFKQLSDWVFEKKAISFSEFTNISKKNRDILQEHFCMPSLQIQRRISSSKDASEKFVLRTESGHFIEAVLIDAGDTSNAYILCLSSQKGCSFSCRFCATGTMGFLGNLSSGEIVSQYLLISAVSKKAIKRIVFMGMGEPFLNRKNVFLALDLFCGNKKDFTGFGISPRKMAISSSGICSGMRALAEHPLAVKLSLSLHSALQKTRDALMPDFEKTPLASLAEAMLYYSDKKKMPVFVEYIMIHQVNDSDEHLKALLDFLKPLHIKLNFIAYNKIEGKDYEPSFASRIADFIQACSANGIQAMQRYKKGDDIAAACGQLTTKSYKK